MPDTCNIYLQSTLLGLIWVRNEVNALFHIGSTFWLRLEPILFVFAPLLGPAVSGLINLLGSKTSTTCYTRLETFYTAHLKLQCSFPTAAKQLRQNLQLVQGFEPSTFRLESVSWGPFPLLRHSSSLWPIKPSSGLTARPSEGPRRFPATNRRYP